MLSELAQPSETQLSFRKRVKPNQYESGTRYGNFSLRFLKRWFPFSSVDLCVFFLRRLNTLEPAALDPGRLSRLMSNISRNLRQVTHDPHVLRSSPTETLAVNVRLGSRTFERRVGYGLINLGIKPRLIWECPSRKYLLRQRVLRPAVPNRSLDVSQTAFTRYFLEILSPSKLYASILRA